MTRTVYVLQAGPSSENAPVAALADKALAEWAAKDQGLDLTEVQLFETAEEFQSQLSWRVYAAVWHDGSVEFGDPRQDFTGGPLTDVQPWLISHPDGVRFRVWAPTAKEASDLARGAVEELQGLISSGESIHNAALLMWKKWKKAKARG